jgi:tRNA threonylcarbamoyladenosine biosynthesis protein TsaE
MQMISAGPRKTLALAQALGQLAQPGTVLILAGPLGAGKTSFVQGLALGLGITGVVNSPTFTIVKEYRGRLPLFHFDLYRLDDPEELWELGLEEYLAAGGVCALEWGERAREFLPRDHLQIFLEPKGPQERAISFAPRGPMHAKLVEELMNSVDPGN